MKKGIMLFGFLAQLFSGKAQKSSYDNYPVYKGNDLGLTYSPLESKFRIWAPSAEKVRLLFYNDGLNGTQTGLINMKKDINGTWIAKMKGNLKGRFYVFQAMINNKWLEEVPDPYAKAVGVNGKRAMVIELKDTSPIDWLKDKSPEFKNVTDAVIYELHIRDASIMHNSGIKNKGKYLGLTEKGTVNAEGLSTGLDHIKELGITHVHLLPCFDFNSIDETKPDASYNWGYDPQNYNVPEGSYATNPYDGITRIKEFKQLVKTFHENGLRVVMDVVYNHTALTEQSNFNQLVPGYYYRQTTDGQFSNATACGNETASERPMMRKFMLESVLYWVNEYHVDGFRFDLMGVHDIETMNLISKELHKIKPDILLYGEGWTAGASPLPDSLRALKANAAKLDSIAVFSDDIRDGIKGSVFENADRGFVSGKPGMEESIKFGIAASCNHPQVNYSKVNYSKKSYAANPINTITYCSCHDNHTLWDKLALSAVNATEIERINMQKLALSIVLTSQGIAFLHAGSEFLRTKKGIDNSFKSPDNINGIDWSLKTRNKAVVDYVKILINMRKEHVAFRMKTATQIAENISFMDGLPPGVIAYTMNGKSVDDTWKKIVILLNGTGKKQSVLALPEKLNVFLTSNRLYPGIIKENENWELDPYSCSILYE